MNIDNAIRDAIRMSDKSDHNEQFFVEKAINILEGRNLTESRYAQVGQVRQYFSELVKERTQKILRWENK